jgi:hypothetical protein
MVDTHAWFHGVTRCNCGWLWWVDEIWFGIVHGGHPCSAINGFHQAHMRKDEVVLFIAVEWNSTEKNWSATWRLNAILYMQRVKKSARF